MNITKSLRNNKTYRNMKTKKNRKTYLILQYDNRNIKPKFKSLMNIIYRLIG